MTASAGAGSGSGRAIDRVWIGTALVIVLVGAVVQGWSLAYWFGQGGGPWVQADWLINLAAGPVRRGPFGEGILALARLSGVPVLTLLIALQAAMAILLYGLTLRLIARQRQGAAVLAVFSAAFFVFVVATLPASGMRKEIFGLVALLLLAVPGGSTGRLAASGLSLGAGAFGHELGVLFLPAWGIALALLRPQALSDRGGRAVIAATVLAVALAAGWALAFPRIPDPAPICAAIRAAGPVAPDFCDGAIAWLARADSGLAQVQGALQGLGPVALAVAVLALGPLARLLHLCAAPLRLVLALVAAAAPFLLLYPLGFDWGRWLMIQVSTAAILTLGLMAQGRLHATRAPGALEPGAWLVLAVASGLNLSMTLLPMAAIGNLGHILGL